MTARLLGLMMLPLTPTRGTDGASTIPRALTDGGIQMISQELKQQLSVDGGVLEYDVVGAGEPVVGLVFAAGAVQWGDAGDVGEGSFGGDTAGVLAHGEHQLGGPPGADAV